MIDGIGKLFADILKKPCHLARFFIGESTLVAHAIRVRMP
jgi:hypothetical protein